MTTLGQIRFTPQDAVLGRGERYDGIERWLQLDFGKSTKYHITTENGQLSCQKKISYFELSDKVLSVLKIITFTILFFIHIPLLIIRDQNREILQVNHASLSVI